MLLIILLLLILAGIFPLSIYLSTQFYQERPDASQILDAEFFQPNQNELTQGWWESKRPLFNQCLVVAGLCAFLCYHLLSKTDAGGFRIDDPSAYFFLLQVITYLIYMGVANLFFNLGPILETGYQMEDPTLYRKSALHRMIAIAMLLPLMTAIAFYLID